MGDKKNISTTLYSNKLDIKKFERLLRNNDQGYKFFWFEAIMRLIPSKVEEFTFEDVINEMIWEAWKTVTHYHLRLGHTVNGNAENFLEHAIRILYECVKDDLNNKAPSREQLMRFVQKYDDKLQVDKQHLTDYVPYRLIKPFVEKEGKEYIDRKCYKRFISYLNGFSKMNNKFFYDIIDAELDLQKKIRINVEWREFMIQNHAVIMGWIQYNKAQFIQDRNPGVPGVMYKVSPEDEDDKRRLGNARTLWKMTVELTGKPLYEIYTGNTLEIDKFDLDHFVPRSYISNDELWNLTPMSKNLNSSKNNRLPAKGFMKEFIRYQYYLYTLIFNNIDSSQAKSLMNQFEKCERHNLNAIWASEKLYIAGNSQTQFGNILEENLDMVYESAKLQEYDIWEM